MFPSVLNSRYKAFSSTDTFQGYPCVFLSLHFLLKIRPFQVYTLGQKVHYWAILRWNGFDLLIDPKQFPTLRGQSCYLQRVKHWYSRKTLPGSCSNLSMIGSIYFPSLGGKGDFSVCHQSREEGCAWDLRTCVTLVSGIGFWLILLFGCLALCPSLSNSVQYPRCQSKCLFNVINPNPFLLRPAPAFMHLSAIASWNSIPLKCLWLHFIAAFAPPTSRAATLI